MWIIYEGGLTFIQKTWRVGAVKHVSLCLTRSWLDWAFSRFLHDWNVEGLLLQGEGLPHLSPSSISDGKTRQPINLCFIKKQTLESLKDEPVIVLSFVLLRLWRNPTEETKATDPLLGFQIEPLDAPQCVYSVCVYANDGTCHHA